MIITRSSRLPFILLFLFWLASNIDIPSTSRRIVFTYSWQSNINKAVPVFCFWDWEFKSPIPDEFQGQFNRSTHCGCRESLWNYPPLYLLNAEKESINEEGGVKYVPLLKWLQYSAAPPRTQLCRDHCKCPPTPAAVVAACPCGKTLAWRLSRATVARKRCGCPSTWSMIAAWDWLYASGTPTCSPIDTVNGRERARQVSWYFWHSISVEIQFMLRFKWRGQRIQRKLNIIDTHYSGRNFHSIESVPGHVTLSIERHSTWRRRN